MTGMLAHVSGHWCLEMLPVLDHARYVEPERHLFPVQISESLHELGMVGPLKKAIARTTAEALQSGE